MKRATGFSEKGLQHITAALQRYVDNNVIGGAVALIHRHGEEAYFQSVGWQDIDAKIPMGRDTLFRIASMTKPIAAAAALILVDQGQLQLFDPVDQWLPELANRKVMRNVNGPIDDVYPSPRAITLHDLLTNKMGLGWGRSALRKQLFAMGTRPVAPALQIPVVKDLDPDAWMERLGEFPLINSPGERWLYHISWDVIGVLIARVTNKPVDEFLQENIFGPLGMKDTGFYVPKEKLSRLATLYAHAPDRQGLVVRDGGGSSKTLWAEPPLFPSLAGGLISSVDDCQRFELMLSNKGELNGERILPRKSVEAMTTDYLTPEQHGEITLEFDRYDMDPKAGPWDNWGYGYGLGVRTRKVGLGPNVGAFYWPGAFGTTWIADPEEDLVATVFTQVAFKNPFYTDLGGDFFTLCYQAIAD